MYLCAKGTEFASSYDFSMGLRNCSDSVALFVFVLDLGNVPTVWHYLFSDQFQSPIEKQIMLRCRNSSKIQYKNK
jgi:hypothetical protein